MLALAVICMAASCAKEGPNGAQGIPGPYFTGAIGGHVSLYDQYGSQVLGGLKSVNLVLEGSSTANPSNIYPDTNGLYSFSPVTTGNYSITANDPGYAYTVLNGIQFVSGMINVDIKLSQIPVFSATAFTAAKATASLNDSLVISFAPDTRARNCIIFVNSVATGTDTASPPGYLLAYKKAIAANDSSETLLVPAQDLYNLGFISGSMVYYSEFSYVINDRSVYEDTVTGQQVYYAVSHPKLDSAQAP